MDTNYIKFKGSGQENDLIRAILNSSMASAAGANFPKVSVIGRTPVTPDIDWLQVRKTNGSEKLIGFETKVVAMREEKGKVVGLDWQKIYAAIGEALLCLRHGLDQCGLILGFHENVPDEQIRSLTESLKSQASLLTQALGPHFTLGFFPSEGGGIHEITNAKSDFIYYGYSDPLYGKKIEDRIKNFRNNLFAREFMWNKGLARQCRYAEK